MTFILMNVFQLQKFNKKNSVTLGKNVFSFDF